MNVRNTIVTSKGWLLFAASLPGRDATSARVRLWRSLRDLGAANVRDGVTLVPASDETGERFAKIAEDIEGGGGAAWIFALPPQEPNLEARLRSLFDRSEAYRALKPTVAALRKELPAIDEATARRRLREVEGALAAVTRLDFFPGAEGERFRDAMDQLRVSIDRRFSPEEPSAATGGIQRRSARKFKGATWATRKRLWVDRVASAWLIKRFIDPRAKFQWLDKPADCPEGSHGFDFDGAEFTHVGDLVTFEVLVAAFGLSGDEGLAGLAQVVHYLDVGGAVVVPEAAGFEAVLAGLRDNTGNDDELLAAASPVLDALYQHFSTSKTNQTR
jgi:hypothetical protein